jgi:serine/threonine-protein kinase
VDPVRYGRIKTLFAEALERTPAERPAFLVEACGPDGELRAEVESLLEYEVQDDFLEPPVARSPSGEIGAAMAAAEIGAAEMGAAEMGAAEKAAGKAGHRAPDPLVGASVGPYVIIDRLGAGGMGVVYVAEDSRLGRRAALKFLRRDAHTGDDARARFVREARAVAALEHPNICTLYGIDYTADGQMFLAMAYYQGETLKGRLARGRLW